MLFRSESLVITSIALGILSAVHHPIRLVFISIVVPKTHLTSAIGLNSVSWNMSRVVGPGISGFAIVFLGLANTFCLALVSYLPLIVTLFVLPLSVRKSDGVTKERFLEKMRNGARVALNSQVIFTALCIVALNSFFIRGVLEIQPAIVGQILGGDSQALALATAAAGVGALLASAWIGLGRLQSDFVQRSLWLMLVVGLVGKIGRAHV